MNQFIEWIVAHSASKFDWKWFWVYLTVFYIVMLSSTVLRFYFLQSTPMAWTMVGFVLCFMSIVYPVEGAATLLLTIPLWIWLADMWAHYETYVGWRRASSILLACMIFFMSIYIFWALIRSGGV